MSLRLAAHWTATAVLAAIVMIAAAIPFTGLLASMASTTAAAGVCLIGIATAPTITRKERSR